MNDSIATWLHQVTQLPGIIVCGLLMPDRTTLTHSVSEDFPEDRMDRVWQRLAEISQTLTIHRVSGQQLRWNYENAHIHYAVRSDGTGLGLVSLTGLAAPDPHIISNLVDQFLSTT